MSYAVASRTRLRLADARWLLVGVLVHALLLAIPLSGWTPQLGKESARLVIRLLKQPLAGPASTPQTASEAGTVEEPLAIEAAEILAQPDSADLEPPPDAAEFMDPGPDVSAAGLIGLRDSVIARVPLNAAEGPAALSLGHPRPYQRPENWQPGAGAEALAPFDNPFNGKTVPEDVEIVDRWLAADGGHNVVVETPAGLRLCGRAQAWDPARPLVEHVMAWQVCGGDFARPFKYKPRKPLDRDFIDPVAKDATEP